VRVLFAWRSSVSIGAAIAQVAVIDLLGLPHWTSQSIDPAAPPALDHLAREKPERP
jgi:hypothetical protein